MKKIAISIGDINGVGPHIALLEHNNIVNICHPIYCVHQEILQNACEILHIDLPKNMEFSPPSARVIPISPGKLEAKSGQYSYASFLEACSLAQTKQVHSICTLPIHKKAWHLANIVEVGHTDVLSKLFKKKAIMMLGCKEMFIALFSDHIPLKDVSAKISFRELTDFLVQLYKCVKMNKTLVLGVNPHCGDDGVMGSEDSIIDNAIKLANEIIAKEVFVGPFPPDTAFSPKNREKYHFFVSMYHDVGLAVLKALYFYESINVTLNIPILRTSVDHGVAYDIAYKNRPNTQSYLNAISMGVQHGIFNE
ncbi:4-hydroxythreonine-4-phosphate dehydrogenase [Helicobacter sp. 11S03491-1]|uniref:4-hydroxythreonine-4-phosphate dehydrogenase n=1 Tax=Helicobacter sp. 11S03491-1 TaxID=1476196 RepID=UPI000BA7A211|nr:4-hydroxythreonine-4-phosphate dehydrogenase [Helicobacter sp. 11S03491-1]PAF43026.1 4-hydroxythreonine-4-phosphate dehydrogenase [Helicobacter sp. 11S03491-1]